MTAMLAFGRTIKAVIAIRCLIVLSPLLALVAFSGDSNWLRAEIVTISAFIALERCDLAPFGVVLHGVAILTGFMLLLLAFSVPFLFVLCCAMLAAASILVTVRGAKLRSLGNFIFIPSLYLACEVVENSSSRNVVVRGFDFAPFMVVAIVPVLILSIFNHVRTRNIAVCRVRHFICIQYRTDHGDMIACGKAVLTVVLAVTVAAMAVEWLHLDHGQLVVWSAASVVTGDSATALLKLCDRAIGAIVGAPLGIAGGLVLPHSQIL